MSISLLVHSASLTVYPTVLSRSSVFVHLPICPAICITNWLAVWLAVNFVEILNLWQRKFRIHIRNFNLSEGKKRALIYNQGHSLISPIFSTVCLCVCPSKCLSVCRYLFIHFWPIDWLSVNFVEMIYNKGNSGSIEEGLLPFHQSHLRYYLNLLSRVSCLLVHIAPVTHTHAPIWPSKVNLVIHSYEGCKVGRKQANRGEIFCHF